MDQTATRPVPRALDLLHREAEGALDLLVTLSKRACLLRPRAGAAKLKDNHKIKRLMYARVAAREYGHGQLVTPLNPFS